MGLLVRYLHGLLQVRDGGGSWFWGAKRAHYDLVRAYERHGQLHNELHEAAEHVDEVRHEEVQWALRRHGRPGRDWRQGMGRRTSACARHERSVADEAESPRETCGGKGHKAEVVNRRLTRTVRIFVFRRMAYGSFLFILLIP